MQNYLRHLWKPAIAFSFILCSPCLAQVIPIDYLTITPIREVGSSTDELGYAGSKINATSFKIQSLATAESSSGEVYQFTSYYDSNQKLTVGRRKQITNGWSDWTMRHTNFTTPNIHDSHNISSIGIDGEGYLHISWGMHNIPLLYTRSATSVTNDSSFTLVGDIAGNSAALGSEITSSNQVTYPKFYNVPDSDDLLFSYRIGITSDGDAQLHRWNATTNNWSSVHSGADPWIDGHLTSTGIPSAYSYLNSPVYDSEGDLHATWTWRTGGDSTSGFGNYQSNHNIMYARSPNDGVDWFKNDGTPYQRNGVHAIDEASATPVVAIPEGSSLVNSTSMTVGGPNDNVYVTSWWAPEAAQDNHLRQYMLAWENDGVWQTSQITDRNPENTDEFGVSQRMSTSQLFSNRMTRPVVAVDDEDRVIVAFTDVQRNNKLTIAYSEDSARDDWVLFDLNNESVGSWEANFDINRWNEDGIISMFYQREEVGGASTVVSVLEWDARSYFENSDGTPFIRSDLNVDGMITAADWELLSANNLLDLSSFAIGEQYRRGDVDRDGDNDIYDFQLFLSDFEAFNGQGSFSAMLQGVPEPTSVVLLAGCMMGIFTTRRRPLLRL